MFDVSAVLSSKSILSFFKKPAYTVKNGADDVVNIPESSCTVVNSDVNRGVASRGVWGGVTPPQF